MPKKGKKGVDQRVKGNVKSANSQRMAELMGGDVGGVIGFDALSARASSQQSNGSRKVSVGEASGLEPLYGDSSQFQIVLKQLGKRDPTTKMKALEEFSLLTYRLPPPATVGVLSLWCIMYNKLSMDNDKRVRDGAHRALKSVVEVVKGSLGAHLRSIIGCWVSGMNDPSKSVSSTAVIAFLTAFPARVKQVETYQYCFKAIISHAADMVLKNTPDSFSDPKVMSQEERVQRFERALAMAVSSVRNPFMCLSTKFILENKKVWEDFLGDKKVWKLTRHQNPVLRAAAFSIVPLLCQRDPDFVQSKWKLLGNAVLGSLAESDPTVVGPLWEAAIMLVTKTETWNENVGLEKTLLPGMWSLLAAGGYGSATVIYPCLLPLLGRLMEKVYGSDFAFASRFLDRLRGGIQLEKPLIPRDEFEVQVQTFNECLLYLVMNLKVAEHFRVTFGKQALTLLLGMVSTSLRKGPSLVQSEVIFSHSVKLTGKLLQLQDKVPSLRPGLSNFQLHLSTTISELLESPEDIEHHFARVSSVLKCIFSHSLWNAMQRKSLRFTEPPEIGIRAFLRANITVGNYHYYYGSKEEELACDAAVRDFAAPTICSLCSNSIAAVSRSVDPKHSQLLLTMVRLYANRTLVKSVYSSLESSHHQLLREYHGDNLLQKKLLVICTVLSKAARLETGLSEHPQFTADIIESIVLLLKCDLVNTASAGLLLGELIKSSVAVLPLVLVKLKDTDQPELLRHIVENCGAEFASVLANLKDMHSVYLWQFLETILSEPGLEESQELVIFPVAFGSLCQILTKSLQSEECPLTPDVLKNMFEVVGKVRPSLMQDNLEAVTILLGCIQHWCMTQHSDLAVLCSAVECYRNLLSRFPDAPTYICSLPSLVLQEGKSKQVTKDLHSTVVSAVLYLSLHSNVMEDPVNIVRLYGPMLEQTEELQGSHFPLSGLEDFCNGHLLFSPIANNKLTSANVTSDLSSPLLRALYPVVALTGPKQLQELDGAQEDATEDSKEGVVAVMLNEFVGRSSPNAMTALLFGRSGEENGGRERVGVVTGCGRGVSAVVGDKDDQGEGVASEKVEGVASGGADVVTDCGVAGGNVSGNQNVGVAGGGATSDPKANVAEDKVSHDQAVGVAGVAPTDMAMVSEESERKGEGKGEEGIGKVLDRMARTIITSLALSIATLKGSQLKKTSMLESSVHSLLRSTLTSCLQEASSNTPWLQELVQGLLERLSMEGPVFLLVLNELFGCLAQCQSCDSESSVLQAVISVVMESSVGSGVLQCCLCSVGEQKHQHLLTDMLKKRESDLYFLTDCLCLHYDSEELVSSCSSCLSLVAQNQGRSELAVFSSLFESTQDSLCFTIMAAVQQLLRRHQVPSEVWEFVLISLVTVAQLMLDVRVSSSVNESVFCCQLFSLIHDVCGYFESPHCRFEQLSEWAEFFRPDLQGCLFTLFMKQSTPKLSLTRASDPCLQLHHLHLCRAVGALSKSPITQKQAVSFPKLLQVVTGSDCYPQQAAAYLLTRRMLDLYTFYGQEDSPPASDGSTFSMSVKTLQDMLTTALESIDMDTVFLEDSRESMEDGMGGDDSFSSTQGYSHTSSYIFIWMVLIEAMSRCSPEIKVGMVEWLKELSLFDHFLHGLFKYLTEHTTKQSAVAVCLHPSVEQLAVLGYSAVATHLPLMLRQWHLTLDRQTSALVSTFTTKSISPGLQQVELQKIAGSKTSVDNMEVHVYSGASEVSVTYKVEDFSIQLFVCLPDSYPLLPPSIKEGRRIKVDPTLWRKWMLQLNIFVTNQNGSLLDGLMLWKSNLDKHFSGADDCMICFSVIHSSNYSLPKMVCKTCKKKFHSACLFKWFSSSTQSSCPLCRNIF